MSSRVGIICNECESKGVVQSSKKITSLVTHEYCQCTNVHCGHTWRQTRSFDHTITPPAGTNNQLVLELLQTMPPEQRQAIVQQVSANI